MPKNREIERKFLVVSDAFKDEAVKKQEITQGYLSKDEARTVSLLSSTQPEVKQVLLFPFYT